jgi:hypothetical protein
MSAPKRIQRQRTRGWRMPEGAVYVGRGSRWGNPFRRESPSTVAALERGEIASVYVVESRADAVFMFRKHKRFFNVDLAELRGKDLACWCALDQPCHADVLLEWANAPGGAE